MISIPLVVSLNKSCQKVDLWLKSRKDEVWSKISKNVGNIAFLSKNNQKSIFGQKVDFLVKHVLFWSKMSKKSIIGKNVEKSTVGQNIENVDFRTKMSIFG